ncbi:hypothetical protein [Hyphococcus sp.]|uniref:hypothetical protein n=1 Tax=Hyphococcus sp. TaxID=2038636 RepID=UPI003D0BA6A6
MLKLYLLLILISGLGEHEAAGEFPRLPRFYGELHRGIGLGLKDVAVADVDLKRYLPAVREGVNGLSIERGFCCSFLKLRGGDRLHDLTSPLFVTAFEFLGDGARFGVENGLKSHFYEIGWRLPYVLNYGGHLELAFGIHLPPAVNYRKVSADLRFSDAPSDGRRFNCCFRSVFSLCQSGLRSAQGLPKDDETNKREPGDNYRKQSHLTLRAQIAARYIILTVAAFAIMYVGYRLAGYGLVLTVKPGFDLRRRLTGWGLLLCGFVITFAAAIYWASETI